MNERKKTTAVVAGRYQKARKKDKGLILDEFVKLTGYTRRYASHVLISHGRQLRINERYVLQMDVKKAASRKRPKVYDAAVAKALKEIWYIMDCICGKRLAPDGVSLLITIEWSVYQVIERIILVLKTPSPKIETPDSLFSMIAIPNEEMYGINMNRVLLMMALFLLCFISVAEGVEWVHYATHYDSSEFYYDSGSIAYPDRDRDIARIWSKTIYSDEGKKSPEQDIGVTDISESKALTELNCRTREFQTINLIFYNSSMDTVLNISGLQGWDQVPPQSIIEALFKIVCTRVQI